jgi:outer membrane receptor for ferrienterochelin and colicins
MTGQRKPDRSLRVGVLVMWGCLLSGPVSAQAVDYGSLEALFGEPVTTTATGKPQKASEAPVAMEIVTADQIRRMGVSSLPEVLNRMPGVISWQGTRSWADVGIRGQNSTFNPSLLVLLNGRQVYIDTYGYTDWSLIPVQMEEIRQIEVVKGPTTALYGFNAVSGVVNIVTYNPKYDDAGEMGLVGGTDNYHRAYGFKTFKMSEKAHVRFSGSYEGFEEFDQQSKTNFAGGPSAFQDPQNRKLLADGLVQLTDNTQLRMEASVATADGNDNPLSYSSIVIDKIMRSGKVALTSETSIGLVEANLYTNYYETDSQSGAAIGTMRNQITVAQLQDTFKLGTDHTFRLQGEYRRNSVESEDYIGPGADVYYDAVAAGGMWNWALTPSVEWTNALRLDHLMLGRDGGFNTDAFSGNDQFDQNVTDYSINTGIVWKATDMDTLRASYGRGIQAPSLFGFGSDLLVPGPFILAGNPNLDTTVVHNYEVGYDRRIASLGGKFRSSLFYKRTEDVHTVGEEFFLTPGFTPALAAGEIGDSETAGIELGLDGTIGTSWRWDMSYIYQNTVDDFGAAGANPSPVVVRYEDTVPHHVLKGHLGYGSGPWAADLYGQAASTFDALSANGVNYDVVELDGYYTLGARLGYSFDSGVVVALSGADLIRDGTASSYGLENERRAYLSVSKRF